MTPLPLLVAGFAATAWMALAADSGTLSDRLAVRGYRQVHFKLDDRGYPLLPVSVNGVVMRFLLDTGAGMSAVSSQVARDLRLPVTENAGTVVGAGGTARSRYATLDSLCMGSLRTGKTRLAVCVLNEPLPSGVVFDRDAIEGLMGADFLTPSRAIIDYQSRTLFFLHPDERAAPVRPPGDILQELGYGGVDLATNAYGHLLIPVTLHGTNRLDLILDSGVTHSVLDLSVVRELALATDVTRTRGTGVGGSLGKVRRTRLEQLVIGPAVLRRYPVFVANLNPDGNETSLNRARIRGVLGSDILRFFCAVISYPDRRLYLKPPRKPDAPSR